MFAIGIRQRIFGCGLPTNCNFKAQACPASLIATYPLSGGCRDRRDILRSHSLRVLGDLRVFERTLSSPPGIFPSIASIGLLAATCHFLQQCKAGHGR